MNKAYYKRAKQPAPKLHEQGVELLKDLLARSGIDVMPNAKITLQSDIGQRTYEPDIYARATVYNTAEIGPTELLFILEVDGKSHDDSGGYQSRAWKDKIRDEAFLKIGKPTVRFDVEELVGPHKLTEQEQWDRIYEKGLKACMNVV